MLLKSIILGWPELTGSVENTRGKEWCGNMIPCSCLWGSRFARTINCVTPLRSREWTLLTSMQNLFEKHTSCVEIHISYILWRMYNKESQVQNLTALSHLARWPTDNKYLFSVAEEYKLYCDKASPSSQKPLHNSSEPEKYTAKPPKKGSQWVLINNAVHRLDIRFNLWH